MENVKKQIEESLNCNDHVVVGVSGGADSMVLLYLLQQVKKQKQFIMQVVHIEHGIRGEQSKSDANFVKEYCLKNKINCKIVSADIPSLAKKNKQTVEECARNFRYQQFYKSMGENGKLFIAHNKNDQAETVLMHIFRGAGISGAVGIKQSDKIFRPLLNVTKEEILQYANKNNIKYVVDSTNDDTSYSRNYVRAEILPVIQKLYPSAIDAIVKFANSAQECDNLIKTLIKPEWLNKKQNSVSTQALTANPVIAKKVIEWAYNNCGEYSDLQSKHVLMLQEFADICKNGSTCNLPHGIIAEKRNNEVLFYKLSNKDTTFYKFGYGINKLPNGKTVTVSKISQDDVTFGDGNYYVDYLKVPTNAVWRTRKDGDYFARLGSGKKKLNDYFTDKKLPKNMRDEVIVLAKGNTVYLVLGQDISQNVKIDDESQEIAKIQL